jgi:hypothetical protein
MPEERGISELLVQVDAAEIASGLQDRLVRAWECRARAIKGP